MATWLEQGRREVDSLHRQAEAIAAAVGEIEKTLAAECGDRRVWDERLRGAVVSLQQSRRSLGERIGGIESQRLPDLASEIQAVSANSDAIVAACMTKIRDQEVAIEQLKDRIGRIEATAQEIQGSSRTIREHVAQTALGAIVVVALGWLAIGFRESLQPPDPPEPLRQQQQN
ncbi:MAG: hypothetical protein HC910_22900 [Spirulinaceae cyanobacterium SM2_1_0]|nr:hypothetical protein [Spirulinaceae cyanobacterium SM2_1_0]